jgi:hypothetical protein
LAPYAKEKGLVPWNPREESISYRVLQAILATLEIYRRHLPLGNRSIMYLLLPQWVPQQYASKDALLKMLTHVLTRARRSGRIPFNAIDDQRTTFRGPLTVADSLDPEQVKKLQIDRQAGQPFRVEVWVETKGNVARLANLCAPFGINVYSGSGSVPIAANLATARRVIRSARQGQRTVLLVLCDFDPMGITSIANALRDDVTAFVRQLRGDPDDVIVRHPAITPRMAEGMPEAVREPYTPPPHAMQWPWPYKIELEAIRPNELDRLVLDAIDQLRDNAAYVAALRAEPRQRVEAVEHLAEVLWSDINALPPASEERT